MTDLTKLSLKSLRTLYSDKLGDAKGIACRTKLAYIAAIEALPPSSAPITVANGGQAPGSRVGRRVAFNAPAKAVPGFPLGGKMARMGSKRAQVIAMLTEGDGATFEEVGTHIAMLGKWNPEDKVGRVNCTEGIRLIHTMLGWGLREDPATGKIQAFRMEADDTEEVA